MTSMNTTRGYIQGILTEECSSPTQLGCRDTVSIQKDERMVTAYAFHESIRGPIAFYSAKTLPRRNHAAVTF